jgi:hypothetical protein
VVRTLRRAGGRCSSGERRANSSVGRDFPPFWTQRGPKLTPLFSLPSLLLPFFPFQRLWQRRAGGFVVWACGAVLSFFSELVCKTFPPFWTSSTGTEACPLLFPSLSPPPLLPLSAHAPRVPASGAPRISARWPRLLEKINWFEHEGRCWGSHRRFSTSATLT